MKDILQTSIHTFAVCRTVSSERMSKCPKGVPLFCRALTTRELKPHRGTSGVPFMRSMTGWLLISRLTLSTAASLVWGVGLLTLFFEASVLLFSGPVVVGAPILGQYCSTFAVSMATSAPSSLLTTLPSWTEVGFRWSALAHKM